MRPIRPVSPRMRRTALTLAAATLLLLVQIHAPLGTLNILWRYVVLSFDNPSTQILDELACEKVPCGTPVGEAGEATRLAAAVSQGLQSSVHAALPGKLALSSCIVRSPPAS